MNKIVLLLVLAATVFTANAQSQVAQDSLYIRRNYTKMEKYITMRDGKRLFTSIYLPTDQSKKYPILMTRTPYTVGPYGANEFRKTLGQNMLFAKSRLYFCLPGCARQMDE